MARKTDIQYISYYSAGNTARKLELVQPKPETVTPQPKAQPRKRPVVYVDPLALCSIVVSAVMLVLMVVGIVQLNAAHQQEQAMEQHLQELYAQNQQLQADYESGYDLDQVEQDALALGMVPVDQVEHITVRVETVETQPVQTGLWEEICAFFASVFA